jgi:hypothetical protein
MNNKACRQYADPLIKKIEKKYVVLEQDEFPESQ